MIAQDTLFDFAAKPIVYCPKNIGTIEERFAAFHRDNPHVYAALVALAYEWHARNPSRKLGVAMLFERLRWSVAMTTTGGEWKLNNNFRSRYARLIMTCEPQLRDLFKTRELRTK